MLRKGAPWVVRWPAIADRAVLAGQGRVVVVARAPCAGRRRRCPRPRRRTCRSTGSRSRRSRRPRSGCLRTTRAGGSIRAFSSLTCWRSREVGGDRLLPGKGDPRVRDQQEAADHHHRGDEAQHDADRVRPQSRHGAPQSRQTGLRLARSCTRRRRATNEPSHHRRDHQHHPAGLGGPRRRADQAR